MAAAEDCDIRRVLITQMGLVQIVEEAPAVKAERICVTHFVSISACPKELISQLVNWIRCSFFLLFFFLPDVSQGSCGEGLKNGYLLTGF